MTDADWQQLMSRDSAARAAGLGDVWDHVRGLGDDSSTRLVLGVIGSIAQYLSETGFTAA